MLSTFSPREQDIIRLVSEGYTNREIGLRLSLTTGTVKCYISRIKTKDPNRPNRNQFVRYVVRDHERIQAIRLNNWILKWERQIPEAALKEIKTILAEQVADILE